MACLLSLDRGRRGGECRRRAELWRPGCLIDPLLLAASFAALSWAFGCRVALIAGTYVLLIFGATASWIGGCFCRYPWLALLIFSLCCLAKRRFILAGGCLSLAAALRIFPILFVVSLALKMLRRYRSGQPARRYRQLVAGAVATAIVVFLGSLASPGWGAWQDFARSMFAYLAIDPSNAVGWPPVLEALVRSLPFAASEPAASIVRLLITACSVGLAAVAAIAASRLRDVQAVAAGAFLCFIIFGLGSYYYVFLVIPFAADGNSTRAWRHRSAYLGIESVSYLAGFVLDVEQQVTFLIRSLLLGLLFFGFWIEPITRQVDAWRRAHTRR